LLNMVRQLLKIRKTTPALSSGSLTLLDDKSHFDIDRLKPGDKMTLGKKLFPKGVLAYKRMNDKDEVVVLINFTKQKKKFPLDGSWTSLLSVNKTDSFGNGKVSLDTFGGIILKK